MKLFIIVFAFLITNQLCAQNINGLVTDATTRLPIANAQIIGSSATIFTNNKGKFNLETPKIGAKFSVRIMGYETQELTVTNKTLGDTLRIYLKQSAFSLSVVTIKTARNYKRDSLNLRKEYAAVFAHKANFTDMFIKVDPNYRSPFANINPNSTASILKFNVLSAFSLFGKKKGQVSKLKQTLLKDEEMNYVDHVFSKEKVMELTKLKGDSLVNFMNSYRPSILSLKKMTGYELTLYIKNSYAEFIKP